MPASLLNLVVALGACFCSSLITGVQAETRTFDWNITWVTANPDGLAVRPTIGINNQWPLPLLNFTRGDQVVVNMYNGVRSQSLGSTQYANTDKLSTAR